MILDVRRIEFQIGSKSIGYRTIRQQNLQPRKFYSSRNESSLSCQDVIDDDPCRKLKPSLLWAFSALAPATQLKTNQASLALRKN